APIASMLAAEGEHRQRVGTVGPELEHAQPRGLRVGVALKLETHGAEVLLDPRVIRREARGFPKGSLRGDEIPLSLLREAAAHPDGCRNAVADCKQSFVGERRLGIRLA